MLNCVCTEPRYKKLHWHLVNKQHRAPHSQIHSHTPPTPIRYITSVDYTVLTLFGRKWPFFCAICKITLNLPPNYTLIMPCALNSQVKLRLILMKIRRFATSKARPPGFHDNLNDWQDAQLPQWKGVGGWTRKTPGSEGQALVPWLSKEYARNPARPIRTNQLTIKPWTDEKALIFNVFQVMRPNLNIWPEIRLMPSLFLCVISCLNHFCVLKIEGRPAART